MYSNRLSIVLSFVMFSLVSSVGWGNPTASAQPQVVAAPNPVDQFRATRFNQKLEVCNKLSGQAKDACLETLDREMSGGTNKCDSLQSDFKKAFDGFRGKCAKARGGAVDSCVELMVKCSEESTDATSSQMDSMGNTGALAQLLTESGDSKVCPRKTSADAKKDKDDANKLMADNLKSVQESKEKSQEIMASFNSKKSDFEEQTIKLLNEAEEQAVALDANSRKMVNDARAKSKAMANQIMLKNNEITNLKSKMVSLESQKVALITTLVDKCDEDLDKKKSEIRSKIDEMKARGQYGSSGGLGGMNSAKQYWSKSLKDAYNKCLTRAQNQRKLAAAQFQSEYDDTKAKISTAENQKAQLDDEIKQEAANLQLAEEEAQRSGKAKQVALLQTLQLNQDRLATLAKEANQAQQNVDSQNNMMMMQMFMSGQAFAGAKTAYPEGITATIGDVQDEFGAYLSAASAFKSANCCAGKTDGLCASANKAEQYEKDYGSSAK